MHLHLKPLWFASALLSGSLGYSATALASPAAPEVSAAAAPQKSVAKKPARKAARTYSKATLSAFAPYEAPAAAAPLATSDVLGVPATVSTVVIVPPGEGLREQPPSLTEAEAMRTIKIDMPPQDAVASNPDESKGVTVEEAAAMDESTSASAMAGDETELGQEAQSVIDRSSDKPKAQPIASGPLRVRVKDSALRASVQIPWDVLGNK